MAVKNYSSVTFPPAEYDWGEVTSLTLRDSSGNSVIEIPFDAPVEALRGDSVTVSMSDLCIPIPKEKKMFASGTCPFCGEKLVLREEFTKWSKKGLAKRRATDTFACGTSTTSGDLRVRRPRTCLGKKCVKFPKKD